MSILYYKWTLLSSKYIHTCRFYGIRGVQTLKHQCFKPNLQAPNEFYFGLGPFGFRRVW